MPEGVPLQSHSRLPAGRPFGGRRRLPRFTDPSTTSLARAPYAADRPGLPRFRPRGISPPRRLPGSARACGSIAPRSRPWAFLPSERSPRVQVAYPSSGPLAPLSFIPVEPRCGVRGLVTRGLHSTRATFGRRPSPDPAGARGSLSAPLVARPFGRTPRETSRSPWTSYAGLTSVRPFRRLRSFLPCASPFTPPGSHHHLRDDLARAEAGALLGVLAPPEPCSRQTWGPLTRHGRRRPSSRWHRAPLGASCDPGDLRAIGHFSWLAPRALRCWKPSMSGGLERRRPNRLARPVGGHRALRARAVPPFGSNLDSHDLRWSDALGITPRPRALDVDRAARERTRCDPDVRSPEFLSIPASVAP
jgi:hypothetical protein